jgi:hypothetical protein
MLRVYTRNGFVCSWLSGLGLKSLTIEVGKEPAPVIPPYEGTEPVLTLGMLLGEEACDD